MKIRSVTVCGIRGFSEERTLHFDDRLTLIAAPNSYGKTSISEAFELLLYGVTSKVESATFSKEEYKGSYRNRHLTQMSPAFVEATFLDAGSEIQLRVEIAADDSFRKFVNGAEVPQWPFAHRMVSATKPFILQHALKYLLLVGPDERFKGFARLLGLVDLDRIQTNVVSLCTKPEAAIPQEVQKLVNDVKALEARLEARPALSAIAKFLKKGSKTLKQIYQAVALECTQRVPSGTPKESVLLQLLKIREEAVGKIFKERLILETYSETETTLSNADEQFLLSVITDPFIEKYVKLIALGLVQRVLDKARFFGLGLKFLKETEGLCPFCGQTVSEPLGVHIKQTHESIEAERKLYAGLEKEQADFLQSLTDLSTRIETYHKRQQTKVADFLEVEKSIPKLKPIFSPKYDTHWAAVQKAFDELRPAKASLDTAYTVCINALDKVKISIAETKEDAVFVRTLGECLTSCIAEARQLRKMVSDHATPVSEADAILKHELDILAGTEDIAVLIDLLEHRKEIEKKFQIEDVLGGLKGFRKVVDQFVGNKMLNAVSSELTADVMEWYSQIRTTGDPDVHFSGFDLERTAKGDLKARRVQIKATSYGKDLISAASSLSESKLNALGLCVSIATNLKGETPFGFLMIDDPIQSWDAEHEIQFIDVIRKLLELGKQVILLSHNRKWIDQVRSGCRSINGCFYEITGYSVTGPHIAERPWASWRQRLNEVDAILKDKNADNVKLQQAEEEIRIVVALLSVDLYRKRLRIEKSPHDINSDKARKILVECGVDTGLIDRITQTFSTTDDAHHAPFDYAVHRQRIQLYAGWANELAQLVGG